MNKIINTFFYLGLFFFSFNSFDGLKYLGEFKDEAGAYFFVFGFIFLLLSKRVSIPLKSFIFQIILLFFGWCLVTTLLNFQGVSVSYLKHTTGINRFIRQYFSLFISTIAFFLFFYNVLKRMTITEILINVRKTFLYSLIFAFALGVFETMFSIFGIGFAKKIIDVFNLFPFVEKDIFQDRISSIGNEPPLLAIFLITICGWMFSYILTHKGILRFVPTFMVLFLTYFSGSRTGLVVIVLQFILFFIITTSKEKVILVFRNGLAVIFILSMGIVLFNGEKIINSIDKKIESLDFKGNLKKNISNQSRFGMQYASLMVFIDNPIIGVGFGQQSFYARHEYPQWAKEKNYEFTYMYENSAVRSFPPGYNLYTRILAETGIVGFLLLLLLIVFSIRSVLKLKRESVEEKKHLSIILLVTLLGLYINWMQIDSFRMYGIWFSLALFIRMKQKE